MRDGTPPSEQSQQGKPRESICNASSSATCKARQQSTTGPTTKSKAPSTNIDEGAEFGQQPDILRRTEREKLNAMPSTDYAPNAEWMEATTIRFPTELALWQQVMRYRLCNNNRCCWYDGRQLGPVAGRIPLKDKKVANWSICMDYCGKELAYSVPWGTTDVSAQGSLDICKKRCRDFEVQTKKGTYKYVPVARTRARVLGKDEWFGPSKSRPQPEKTKKRRKFKNEGQNDQDQNAFTSPASPPPPSTPSPNDLPDIFLSRLGQAVRRARSAVGGSPGAAFHPLPLLPGGFGIAP
ncbi:MAG: hypothetical protein M1816_005672 [Peltula sp. TS41687]|nr:MAG: hypothetical protein M1816_005672 [Peltula sp. TS41687]